MRFFTVLLMILVAGCSANAVAPTPDDAGTDAGCYPTSGNIRLACEWACGLNERDYQRSGGADAGLYFDYTQCLNECGCDQWPDGGDGQ